MGLFKLSKMVSDYSYFITVLCGVNIPIVLSNIKYYDAQMN